MRFQREKQFFIPILLFYFPSFHKETEIMLYMLFNEKFETAFIATFHRILYPTWLFQSTASLVNVRDLSLFYILILRISIWKKSTHISR